MKVATLAEKLGTTQHVSPLLMKLRRRGLTSYKELAAAAVARGCRHYKGFADELPPGVNTTGISNEELAIALLSPGNPYEPMLIRIASQLLSREESDAAKLATLAKQERCTSTLGYIAECGAQTEPDSPFWKQLLACLPKIKPAPPGIMPHPSRFRIEIGVPNPKTKDIPKVKWLRPVP